MEMVKPDSRSWCLVLALLATSMQALSIGISPSLACSSLDVFIAKPSQASWYAFEDEVNMGQCGNRDDIYAHIVKYHIARKRRDFSNSMVLLDVSANEEWRRQIGIIEKSIAYIRGRQSPDLWKMLYAMADQDDYDFLYETAFELIARVSPEQFEELAASSRFDSQKERYFQYVREIWLPSKK